MEPIIKLKDRLFPYKKIFALILFFFLSSIYSDDFRHVKNITSLLSSTSIKQINSNSFLVSTLGGTYSYNTLTNSIINHTDKLEYVDINDISISEESIWLCGNDGNIQILDTNFNLDYIIDYTPFNNIRKVVFYGNYAFGIAENENNDIVIQYSNGETPYYLNQYSSFLISNNVFVDINAVHDIHINDTDMYIATNQGLLKADLSDLNNSLLFPSLVWERLDERETLYIFEDHNQQIEYVIYTDPNYCLVNNNLCSDLISDIIEVFSYDNNIFVLSSDKLHRLDLTGGDPEGIYSVPTNIISNFNDVEIVNDEFYLALENHGILALNSGTNLLPPTIFKNSFSSIDVKDDMLVGISKEGGFIIEDFLYNSDNYRIRNFYSSRENYTADGFKLKYANRFSTSNSDYNCSSLSYVSGDKESKGIVIDNNGNIFFINDALYLEPETYHPYNVYSEFIDEIDYLSGLLHIDPINMTIIDGWSEEFTGQRGIYDPSPQGAFNYTSLNQILFDENENLWIVNPYSEGNVNKPICIKLKNNNWTYIEDNQLNENAYLPSEIAFDQYNNVWIAYQDANNLSDPNESYSPGGVKLVEINSIADQEDDNWHTSPLSSVLSSSCNNNELELENINVWSIDIGSDKYGNTILWTLSDYGAMGYVINFTYSNYFDHMTIKADPISCQFYFSDLSFGYGSKIRVDKQNNAWINTNSGIRVIKNNGQVWPDNYLIDANNTKLLSDYINDISFDDFGYVYVATKNGISIFETVFASEKSIKNISVSPNPFIIGEDQGVAFTNIPSNSVIQLMTLSGKVVKEFKLNQENVILNWDGIGDNGKYLNTGIYLVAVFNASKGIGTTKIAIIRN